MQSISRRDTLATAAALVEIDPGGLREMHRHPNADESSYDADLSLDTWLALTPPELLQAYLKLDRHVVDASRTNKTPVVPAPFETATGKPGSPYPRPPAE